MALQPESGRTEQIISQFLLKTLHSVLASRIPHLHSARPPDPDAACSRKRDRWFNLALGDLPPPLDNPAFLPHAVIDPMIIDIILSPRDGGSNLEAVVERWTAHCEPLPSISAADYRKTYKKSIVLLRALHSVLRLLPAYRIFRMLCSSNQSFNYDISYRVSSFAELFSREEEKELKLYSFTPVETQFGQLSVSVLYRPSLSDFNFEVSSLLPPMIIMDYVGSPAADPMRAFPSSPADKGSRATSFPLRGVCSTSLPSFQRPHSWTSMPLAHHPLSTSPGSELR